VDRAESLRGRCRRPRNAFEISDVADDRGDARREIPELRERRRQRRRLDIGKHDVHAFGREGAGQREAYAAGGARHEGGAAGKIAHGKASLGREDRIGSENEGGRSSTASRRPLLHRQRPADPTDPGDAADLSTPQGIQTAETHRNAN
jgi:hypothetical protein